LSLERSRCLDGEGKTLLVDPYQWPVSHSESGVDKSFSMTGTLQRTGHHTSARGSLTQALCPPGQNRNRGPWLSFTRFDGAWIFVSPCSALPLDGTVYPV
jgi:hypothetical protein